MVGGEQADTQALWEEPLERKEDNRCKVKNEEETDQNEGRENEERQGATKTRKGKSNQSGVPWE